MKMSKVGVAVVLCGLFGVASVGNVIAAGNHDGGHDHSSAGSHSEHNSLGSQGDHSKHNADHGNHTMAPVADGMFLRKKNIDGYTVSFHVMEANDGMRHGGSHNFMIKVEKDGKVLNDAVINSKVVYPNKKAESKMLMKMGDWYMNGYDLATKGKYQMMVLFKTRDGKKHKGGVYYAQ